MKESSNSKRVALITGANKGIGFETARQMGKQGITVLVGSRDGERGEKAVATLRAEGIDARAIAIDVTRQRTIDDAASKIGHELGRLDILVNNAGILAEMAEPSSCTIENLRKTFETNFFGLFAVTQAFLPLLKKSKAARIVNVSSGLGSLTRMADTHETKYFAYSTSKAAVNMLTVLFGRELKETGIKVNSAAPGYTATDMNNCSGTQTVEEGTVASFRLAMLPDDGADRKLYGRERIRGVVTLEDALGRRVRKMRRAVPTLQALLCRFDDELLSSPVQQFSNDDLVIRGACHFMDPSKLLELLARLAEVSKNLALEIEFVDAARIGIGAEQHLIGTGCNANGPGRSGGKSLRPGPAGSFGLLPMAG